MTPIEQLHQTLLQHKKRGQQVISIKYVLDCLKEEQRMFKLDPPRSLSDTPNIGA